MAENKKSNEKRLIDANALKQRFDEREADDIELYGGVHIVECFPADDAKEIVDQMPTVDAVEVVHGRWILAANEEYSNYRWNVTAECSECHHSKGEIYAGFFPGLPTDLAREVVLDNAEKVKLDNYCPNCGAKMDGGNEDA